MSIEEIVAVDIGGTHARFALAEVESGAVRGLSHEVTFATAEHAGLELAWAHYAHELGRPAPRSAGIAVAGPVHGTVLQLTNSPWVIHPDRLAADLGLDRHVLVNDFGAVAHAVAHLPATAFRHLCGPERDLPGEGVISVLGPGTGLGVAQLVRREGRAHVVETEGGHVDFAPLDTVEDGVLARLRHRFRRVSVERVASGPGLANLYAALADLEGRPVRPLDDAALWAVALGGADALAAAALQRFCLCLGAFAGDVALVQGADAVVLAGGLGQLLADRLPASGFGLRFTAKGRFEARMAQLPVKLVTHPQPGLFGAAAAWLNRFG